MTTRTHTAHHAYLGAGWQGQKRQVETPRQAHGPALRARDVSVHAHVEVGSTLQSADVCVNVFMLMTSGT